MKKKVKIILAVILSLVFVTYIVLFGCKETHISDNATVKLKYNYLATRFKQTLTEEETAKVISILDGKTYYASPIDTPYCGFDYRIAIVVNGRVFGVACDGCNVLIDYTNLRCFDVSQEDIEYLHSLFASYGGHFPCI